VDVLLVDLAALTFMGTCTALREALAVAHYLHPMYGLPCWIQRLAFLQLFSTLHTCLLLRFCIIVLKLDDTSANSPLRFLATARGRIVVMIGGFLLGAAVTAAINIGACVNTS
jgi:hypothetical protein